MSKYTLSRTNYIIMCIAFVMVIIGFILMTGGKTVIEFNPEVFSFRRITLAPLVCLAGFLLMIVGVFYQKKKA